MATDQPQSPLSVLIVDPDMQAAQSLAVPLQATCIVGLATTAADALQLVQRRIPDIIVTELRLPDRTGLDLIASLRQRPETHHVLLVVVTQRDKRRKCLSLKVMRSSHNGCFGYRGVLHER